MNKKAWIPIIGTYWILSSIETEIDIPKIVAACYQGVCFSVSLVILLFLFIWF